MKLSKKALRALECGVLHSEGYVFEPPARSNFDKSEVLPELEALGLVDYKYGHAFITEAGRAAITTTATR